MKKKTLFIGLVIVFCLSCSISVGAKEKLPFEDVPENAWYGSTALVIYLDKEEIL